MIESMRFYIYRHPNNEKVYLNFQADTRSQLAQLIGGRYFLFEKGGLWYDVNDVIAEPGSNNTAVGSILGGVLGLLTGGFGAIIGATLGGLIGNANDEQEKQKVEMFNSSRAA